MARYCFQDVSVIAVVIIITRWQFIRSICHSFVSPLPWPLGLFPVFIIKNNERVYQCLVCAPDSMEQSSAVCEISAFLCILTHTWCHQTLIFVMLMGEKPYLSVFICISFHHLPFLFIFLVFLRKFPIHISFFLISMVYFSSWFIGFFILYGANILDFSLVFPSS